MLTNVVRSVARTGRPGLSLIAAGLLLGPALGAQAQSGGQKPPPPKVPVITVETASAAVYKEYAGRTEANRHVEVRAQVDGILESREYTEGARVAKGDPLFRIDARPYQAAVHEAEADLAAAQATLAAAQRDWRRVNSLFERGVASEKQRDDARSALETARAGVKVAEAQLESAQVDLDYTTVAAPIPGIAGRRAVSAGNLIEVGDRLVSLDEIDPIQIVLSYPLDDPFADSDALNPTPERPTPAEVVGITGPNGQPLTGKLDYRTAAIDEQTNSIRLRGVFDNPGDVLRPNRYVRVRIQVASVSDAVIVPETAIGTGPEPGSTVVYVVGENDTAQQKRVELGPMSDQGRIVESGLEAGERLVIDGLLKVRPGAPVKPQTPSDDND
ncbi:efflux RND transporter periplasmic adaptor subunit [Guyparkeria hydrothermalis]|uniref:efflux RND transporter periplasmic adaptor subunit n=1 Tax=Guyparkeria hydrothermalis TaxID=923 RepID=UPI0020213C81|nr:efflux RND transporter periplasmic adaptor subunit [Guyparkeria hydrothermalis]MCL7743932.1 efflux RND transporter periplasmic adaptor subunit [Guyparkeria hydrothermalis]